MAWHDCWHEMKKKRDGLQAMAEPLTAEYLADARNRAYRFGTGTWTGSTGGLAADVIRMAGEIDRLKAEIERLQGTPASELSKPAEKTAKKKKGARKR